jgi:hypothetical protein
MIIDESASEVKAMKAMKSHSCVPLTSALCRPEYGRLWLHSYQSDLRSIPVFSFHGSEQNMKSTGHAHVMQRLL